MAVRLKLTKLCITAIKSEVISLLKPNFPWKLTLKNESHAKSTNFNTKNGQAQKIYEVHMVIKGPHGFLTFDHVHMGWNWQI